jgi:hypothetical protein
MNVRRSVPKHAGTLCADEIYEAVQKSSDIQHMPAMLMKNVFPKITDLAASVCTVFPSKFEELFPISQSEGGYSLSFGFFDILCRLGFNGHGRARLSNKLSLRPAAKP